LDSYGARIVTQHQLNLSLPKDSKYVRRRGGKRVADETERVAIPQDRTSHICDSQNWNRQFDCHSQIVMLVACDRRLPTPLAPSACERCQQERAKIHD